MHILVVGLNHKTAPVEIRERVNVSDSDAEQVMTKLTDTRTVLESVVLSTCNRTEIYAVVSSLRAGEDYLKTWLAQRAMMPIDKLEPHLFLHSGAGAATHLMKVASGLDSLVIGETQILGQVRTAFAVASTCGSAGALLNQLFRFAIQLGKKAQTETGIGQSPVSVSYAAIQLAKKIFGDLSDRRVLVIGVGEMGRLTAKHVQAQGASEILVVNRTFENAIEAAESFGGRAIPWGDLRKALVTADIVISSTASSEFVLKYEDVKSELAHRLGRPIAFIDIAVPRDIDPAIGDLKNVYLYDIDDLEGVVAANLVERERQAVQVHRMIEEVLHDYSRWLSEQEVVPLISAIRERGMQVQADVMTSLQNKLPNLTERELQLIHKHTMSIVNQMLRDPIHNMKELALAPGGAKYVPVFSQLFGVPDERAHTEQEDITPAPQPYALHPVLW